MAGYENEENDEAVQTNEFGMYWKLKMKEMDKEVDEAISTIKM